MKYLGRDQAIEDSLLDLRLTSGNRQISVVDADQMIPYSADKIIVAKALDNRQIMDLVVNTGARHVVQMPNLDFARQVAFSARILSSPAEFFASPMNYLIGNGQSSLLPLAKRVLHFQTNDFSGKLEVLEKIKLELESISKSENLRQSCYLVADEMLMNILKDAPKYFAANFPHLAADNRSSSINIAYDDSRLLLWTEDAFGSLSIDKMMRRLQECYSSDEIKPIEGVDEGAGLGCRMIFDQSISMSVFVKPGVKTVFCAMLPIGLSFRAHQNLPKNIQILAMAF